MSIRHGDLFDVLPTLDAESIDACVTDPPYELNFMGKRWDDSGISFTLVAWEAVHRALKPGAYLLAFGGTRTYHRMTCAIEDAGFEIRDCLCWLYGQGFPKSLNVGDGRGTALKPAYEPIILARKPFKGALTANLERQGTGALNIDACRIGTADGHCGGARMSSSGNTLGEFGQYERDGFKESPLGRWPANVLLDEEAAAMLDEQSGELVTNPGTYRRDIGAAIRQRSSYVIDAAAGTAVSHGDSGGASRFFYVAKPSREEREHGIYDLEPRQRDDSRKDGNPGGDNPRNRGLQRRGNHHPTVKPVELMRWLVKLVTPPAGTVLDPFCGSGTTGMACAYELRSFIGIEREAEYVEIAKRRISACAPLFQDAGGDR